MSLLERLGIRNGGGKERKEKEKEKKLKVISKYLC